MSEKTLHSKQMRYIGIVLLMVASIMFVVGCRETYANKYGRFVKAGKLHSSQFVYNVVKLKDGRVLVLEAKDQHGEKTIVEIYDQNTRKFKVLKSLPYRFNYSQLTLLQNGHVLITGYSEKNGNEFKVTNNTLLFDPKTNKFLQGPQMIYVRNLHTASLLPNGKVLIVGGYSKGGKPITTCEIYDQQKNKFILGPKLLDTRSFHRAISLKNGDVIIIGGNQYFQQKTHPNSKGFMVERYNFKENKFLSAGYLYHSANDFFSTNYSSACLLKDGRILIIVGEKPQNSLSCTRTEIYDPVSEKSIPLNTITGFRAENPTLTALNNGNAILIGGQEGQTFTLRTLFQTYIFDSKLNQFILGPNQNIPRRAHSVVELDDYRLLVIGGIGNENSKESIVAEYFISK